MQKKYFLPLFLGLSCMFSRSISAQEGLWIDHLSFRSARDVVHNGDEVYVSTEQGVFIYSDADFSVRKLTKINGLSDFDISDITYNSKRKDLVIAYASGNVDIYEPSSGITTNFSDIKRNTGVFGSKAINYSQAFGDSVFFACDFGIVVLDLKTGFFRDTYFIASDGGQIKVSAVWADRASNRIYAATEEGLLTARLSDPLRFFGVWTPLAGAHKRAIKHMTFFEGKVIYAVETLDPDVDSIYVVENGTRTPLLGPNNGRVYEVEAGSSGLEVVSIFNAVLYNSQLQPIQNVSVNADDLKDFSPRKASFNLASQRFWIADNTLGLVRNFDLFYNQIIFPQGPFTNNFFHITTRGRNIYTAAGGVSDAWQSTFNNDGAFRYNGTDTWSRVDPEGLSEIRDVLHISIDPVNAEHYFMSTWGSGLVEILNGSVRNIYTSQNSNGAIQKVNGNADSVYLIGGSTFDPDGNLWMTNALTDNPLVVRRSDGSWKNFSLGAAGGNSVSIRDILYTSENQVWIQTRNAGIIVFEEAIPNNKVGILNGVSGTGNLPGLVVTAMAEDQDGEIWIGTEEGIGVVYTPYNIFENGLNYDAQPILIETDEGIVERLLNGQPISDIQVDGSNKKWVSTSNNGVFYFGEDGTEEIHHFTAENSPLLSNNVIDIAIEDETGFVYFSTDKGLISFKGNATRGGETFSKVYAYPNPVRPGYRGLIFITGLVTNAQMKITDLSGNLVYEGNAEGGQAQWDGSNFSGERVKSGVYLVFLTNDDGSETEMTKILIVN